jgi:hypothetical protein
MAFNHLRRFLIISMVWTVYGFAQEARINEFMSSNTVSVADEDGEFSDWIEIYNPGPAEAVLTGWQLSDDRNEPDKWILPSLSINAGDFLLIYASGKDKRYSAAFWESIIQQGDSWRYFLPTGPLPANWNSIAFDDAAWASGPTGIGYGDGDDATVIPSTPSLYMRKTFTLADPAEVTYGQLHIDYDDSYVAYLNGVEIARAHIGTAGIPPAWNEQATDLHEANMYRGYLPEVVQLPAISDLLLPGANVLAIEIHNYGTISSDMTAIPFLTLGLNQAPANPRGMPELLQFALPELHTNFKISAEGEPLILSNASGLVVDSITAVHVPADYSYGRKPDGGMVWNYFRESTPGAANTTSGFPGLVADVQYSLPAGFYPASLTVALSCPTQAATIRYTLDGSLPNPSSPVYSSPVTLSTTTVLRARAYAPGMLPSEVATQTYLVNGNHSVAVVSLATSPGNFFDPDTGIYALGSNADPNFPFFGANFWQDWERPVHIEFFAEDGTPGFSVNAGVKITGAYSRGFDQKSLAVYFRGEYGDSQLEYDLFPGTGISAFQSFVLRNSGNDWNSSMFRDAFLTGLMEGSGVDYQEYRPAVLYINGQYWGIHNIREKVNEHFIASHHGVNPDNIDMLEWNSSVIHGDDEHYQLLLNFLETHSLAVTENYEYVKTQMDVDNFAAYQIAEIYIDNTDWPGNNIKYWRERSASGVWRWILYDTDFGFGIWNATGYMNNTLAFALATDGPDWPNPPWSTFILRKMLENNSFKNDFVVRFCDMMNDRFLAGKLVPEITGYADGISAEIPAHMIRWNGSVATWTTQVSRMKIFAAQRPAFARQHLQQQFNLSDESVVQLSLEPASSGVIKLNTIIPEAYPWQGIYFESLQMKAEAIPAPGYRFSHWQGVSTSADREIEFTAGTLTLVHAVFVPDDVPVVDIVINEINYNSSADFDPDDWVELYNPNPVAVDLSGWVFKDSDDAHAYEFPANTSIEAEGYLVISSDRAKFEALFPQVSNLVGNTGFGLSGGGELIRLYDASGGLIDSLSYDDTDPWPTEPDGNGPTLELNHPEMDNSLGENWHASLENGTPGALNSFWLDLDRRDDPVVHKFGLYPNYPNPFNPETQIRFSLPAAGRVEVIVFNIAGQEIKRLADQYLAAGNHRIAWRPVAQNASGVYIVRLAYAGKFTTQKIIYLK